MSSLQSRQILHIKKNRWKNKWYVVTYELGNKLLFQKTNQKRLNDDILTTTDLFMSSGIFVYGT